MNEIDIEGRTPDPDQENVTDQNTDRNQNLRRMNDLSSQVFKYSTYIYLENSYLLCDLFELKNLQVSRNLIIKNIFIKIL